MRQAESGAQHPGLQQLPHPPAPPRCCPPPGCRYTRRPWLQQLQDVVPELAGATTEDGKRATPRFPERPQDVDVRGVRLLDCALL